MKSSRRFQAHQDKPESAVVMLVLIFVILILVVIGLPILAPAEAAS